jgi:hypothetical protein
MHVVVPHSNGTNVSRGCLASGEWVAMSDRLSLHLRIYRSQPENVTARCLVAIVVVVARAQPGT